MKQPLRIDGSQLEKDDVALYRRLIRDVCFLYHELTSDKARNPVVLQIHSCSTRFLLRVSVAP